MQNRIDAMQEAHQILKKEGLVHWLACGALLGIYRDGKLIPWDNDVEFDCKAEELHKIAKKLKKLLKAKGFKIEMRLEKDKMNARRDGIKICIAGYRLKGKYWKRWKFRVPKKYFEEVGYIDYEGHAYPCHYPIEDYLKWFYDDWKTPYDCRKKKKSGCWNRKMLTR